MVHLSTNANASMPSYRRGPLHWLAIIATLAFAGFLAIFSLDEPVFSLGFLMHNIPALIVLAGTALGWWRAWAGALWMFAAAVAALVLFHDGWQHWTWPLLINVPPFVLAILFALAGFRPSRR